ncbi:MAG: hypothetical protein WCV91_00355 [Candidatus Margulisiibacteriota bacterium]
MTNRRNILFDLVFFRFIWIFIFGIWIFHSQLFASSIESDPPVLKEAYRIKIWNTENGTIEVSRDKGWSWEPVGKVHYPAEKVNKYGYAASRWIEAGRVAATAVNAIHIKVSQEASNSGGTIFSLLPKEFLEPITGYRSYLSKSSSLYTSIPGGASIFGGGYSPFVGNYVLFSRGTPDVYQLPGWYVPQIGDKLYIIVSQPVNLPKEIEFENIKDGNVILRYYNGEDEIIGKVLKPVVGIGRFEGSRYASIGRIRANHSGVIDITTSLFGSIGGFQIVPSKHAQEMGYPMTGAAYMVIGPTDEASSLEGNMPFFKYFIHPSYGTADLTSEKWEERLLDRFLVEAKIGSSQAWAPMPPAEVNKYFLEGKLPKKAETLLKDVKAIKIIFPVK